jgi:hypothetical protein
MCTYVQKSFRRKSHEVTSAPARKVSKIECKTMNTVLYFFRRNTFYIFFSVRNGSRSQQEKSLPHQHFLKFITVPPVLDLSVTRDSHSPLPLSDRLLIGRPEKRYQFLAFWVEMRRRRLLSSQLIIFLKNN